ncbi:hypothetical protein TNCV_2762361 [Trichonephila clavipes]|nr:hypothetical protein TNCV_2762361 [Trichonephila clavipes]
MDVSKALNLAFEANKSIQSDEIGDGIEEAMDLPKQINLVGDSDDVQELLESHNQELIIDELIEMHEQEHGNEEQP